MRNSLPAELRALVEETVARIRPGNAQRERVRDDLEMHFRDALDAGAAVEKLAAAYGNPRMTARLIERATRRARWHSVLRYALGAAAAAYIMAVASVWTAPNDAGGARLSAQASAVTFAVLEAETHLATPGGIVNAYRIAAHLRRQRTLWSETASLILLDRIAASADAPIDGQGRGWLHDSLRLLAGSEGLAPRGRIVSHQLPSLVDVLYGRDGRIGRAGRQLIVQTKGGTSLPLRARLFEPLFFALPRPRSEIERMVKALIDARMLQAATAAERLTARVCCDASGATLGATS